MPEPETADHHPPTSFTVHPADPATRDDPAGATAETAGAGDATHPERWSAGQDLDDLRRLARDAGLDAEGLDRYQLLEALKSVKPSNRADPAGRDGSGSLGSHT
jgi:hypothetical protein